MVYSGKLRPNLSLCRPSPLNGCLAMSYSLEPQSVEQRSTQQGESKLGTKQQDSRFARHWPPEG